MLVEKRQMQSDMTKTTNTTLSKEDYSLASKIAPLLRKCIVEESNPPRDEVSMAFAFNDIESGLGLSQEGAKLLHEIVDEHLARAFPKAGPNTCLNLLQRFCAELIKNRYASPEQIPFEGEIPILLNRIRTQETSRNTVFVEVCGLNLQTQEWTFGTVNFMRGNHPCVESERMKIRDKSGNYPEPIPESKTVARIEAVGSRDYAVQFAQAKIQETLDVLQFLSIRDNYSAFRESDFGFSLFCANTIPRVAAGYWCLNTLAPSWCSGSLNGPILSSGVDPKIQCQIDKNATAQFARHGGQQLSEMLSTNLRSLFDNALMSAVSWIAHAIRERHLARKYLALYVALEACFVQDTNEARDNRNTRTRILPVEEGVAFVLGRDVQQRRRLAKRVRDLARTRNLIVHRGYTEIERDDLLTLATYAWACCSELALKRDLFRKEGSFKEWLLERKYGAPEA